MGVVSFGYTFVTFSSIYIVLVRLFTVCSFTTGSILVIGVVFVYLFSWWQVEEKLIVIFNPLNMDVMGHIFPFVCRLNQSSFLIFLPIWNELGE